MRVSARDGFLRLNGLDPRDRRAILLGLAVLLPSLAWVFAVRPYREALDNLKDRVSAEQELLVRELALLEMAPTLPEVIRQAEEDIARAMERTLRGPSAVLAEGELTGFLGRSAVENRVLLEEIRTGELGRGEEPPFGLSVVRLHLRGESDLQGILSFLDQIEKSRLLLSVRGLALEPETARPESNDEEDGNREAVPTGVVSFQLIIDGYSRSERGEGVDEQTPPGPAE